MSPPSSHGHGRGRRQWGAPELRVIDLENGSTDDGADRTPRVLVVGDDDVFAKVAVGVLQAAREEFIVERVERLGAAQDRLAGEGIDLVLADLDLPDSQGPRTVRSLKRVAPDVPLIAVSALDDAQVALEAVRHGADEYLVKGTFSMDALVCLARVVLERHRRLVEEQGKGYLDPLSGLGSLAALQVVGRHLLRVGSRTGLGLAVVFLQVEPAPRGRWADREALLSWVSEVLQLSFRRSDLVCRIGRQELAMVLVSNGLRVDGAVRRLEQAVVAGDAGGCVRLGFAAYDHEHPAAFDDLLGRARGRAHPVVA